MKLRAVISVLSFVILFNFKSEAQTSTCTAGVNNGQNLTTNYDFSQGNTGFSFTGGYTYFNCTPLPSSSCYSSAGDIWVGANSSWFNDGFEEGGVAGAAIPDHTSTSDNMFLMSDGVCTLGADAWTETITVVPGTWYYFQAWILNLDASTGADPNAATLTFNINGTNLVLTAPGLTLTNGNTVVAVSLTSPQTWFQVTASWQAPAGVTTAQIHIQNNATSGCGNGVDFGLDDITFTPGCQFADVTTPNPTLTSAGTLCGTNGSITMASGVAPTSTMSYTWINSAGTTLYSGTNSPYQNYAVSAAGTYTVCVQNNGGCLKSATMTVSSTYDVTLPTSVTLCNPPSTTLTPTFGGPSGAVYSTFPAATTKYIWQGSTNGTTWTNFKGSLDSQATYLVNSANPQYYKVIVRDTACGQQVSNSIQVNTQQSATPNDQYFCPTSTVNLSVNGTAGHTYDWYNASVGGTRVAANTTTYTTPAISAATTYYVQDTTVYTETSSVGASALPTGASTQQTTLNQYFTAFTANQSFVIDSVTVYWWMNNSNPNDAVDIQVQLYNYPPGGGTAPTLKLSGTNYAATNSTAKTTPPFPTTGQTVYAVRVPVNITVPSAGTYSLSASSSTTSNVIIQSSNTSYPYNDAANVLSITGTAQDNNSVGTTYYGDFYNWRIHYYLNCGRVAVTATPDCAQPVKFSDFTVKQSSNSVYLNWQTSSEINSSYFDVERSTEGMNFITIGKVQAAGNSDQSISYSFVDNNLVQGYTYYRIVEYDKDGSTTSSSIKSVDITDDNLVIMPNPTAGNFTVTGKAPVNSIVNIIIVNSLGQQISELTCQVAGESFTQVINISNLASGIYYLQIQTSESTQVKKVIKE